MRRNCSFEDYTSTEDFRIEARRVLPKMFYDYIDAGSWDERTYQANENALADLFLRQRVACDVSNRSVAGKILGETRAMPLALSPVGLGGLLFPDAEIVAAKMAAEFDIPYTLSTLSIASIEDVAAHSPASFWFQLYVMRDRSFVLSLIERAKAAGCSALVLTLDLQVASYRRKDVKNDLRVPPRVSPRMILDMITHPRWALRMAHTKRRTFGNIVGHAPGVSDIGSFARWTVDQMDDAVNWSTVEWVRQHWNGKLVLKGVSEAEDAKLAKSVGADAIVVSNHGGRVLDGVRPAISALPEIVEVLENDIEVHFDSGVRSGQDIFRVLASGAQVVHIGRAYIYPLAAGGAPALRRALNLLQDDLDATMGLAGETVTADLGGHNLGGQSPM